MTVRFFRSWLDSYDILILIAYDGRDRFHAVVGRSFLPGKSTTYPPGTPPYQLEDMVDDAIAILNAYQIKKANLVGMSLGGLSAQIAALRHPGRVSSLIFFATGPFGESSKAIFLLQWRAF